MNNIFVLNKNYKQIGVLSNQGANPQAPYFNDLYVQELETGADTYQFSTISSKYTQDLLEIGNHIMFAYRGRQELFTITSLEYSHNEGYKTIGVYAEGLSFELLEVFMERPKDKNGNSSGGGNDSDNDGDDNTDDEYADPDDVYIDANGNIIYDKNGGTDYADPNDVTIDGNGNIIYKRSKNNKKNDSLEFKNISYPTFLNILLKGTGWTYIAQPGLESVKHNISVKYDRNIYAVLQDSMQSYRGVELEFVYEYNNGSVKKVVKAYKDGGRGSFIGKRFEYGTNVRGITKMQEVANSEDDTVLRIDNVGIDITYDIDFALKSAEVPEIEIGDTHYVIDKDFYPPMTIKARIGKIEVSFSDPTVNKIYLANNKRISGSAIEDEFDADDVADMLDDYEFDDGGYGDNGAAYDHYHDRLICMNEKAQGSGIARWQTSIELSNYKLLPAKPDWYDLGEIYTPWDFAYTNNIRNKDEVISPRFTGYNYHVRYDRGEMKDVVKITNSGNVTKQDLLNFIIHDLNVYEYGAIEVYEVNNKGVDDPNAYFDKRYFGILSDDVVTNGKTSIVGDRVQASITTGDINNDGDINADDTGTYNTYNIPALLSCLIGAFQYHVSGGEPTGPTNKDQDAGYDGGGYSPSDPDDPGTDDPDEPGYGTITGTFDVAEGNLLIAKKIEAVQAVISDKLFVKDITGTSISNMTTAEIGAIKTGTLLVDVVAKVEKIEFPDGSTMTTANGSGGGTPSTGNVFDTITVTKIQGPDPGEGQYNCVEFADGIKVGHIWSIYGPGSNIDFQDHLNLHNGLSIEGDLQVEGNILPNEVHTSKVVFSDGTSMTSANGSGGNSSTGDITANKITIGTPTDSKASRCSLCVKGNALIEGTLYIEGSYTVNGTAYSDKSLKENIRYIDAPITYSNDDLEKADLYDFIVNQVNICEYNFIDDDRDKIGFIANEYEGTKVGDKIIFRNEETDLLGYDPNNLLFATIGALQEEIRTRDEKIASLEDRLARLEALLGIDNK